MVDDYVSNSQSSTVRKWSLVDMANSISYGTALVGILVVVMAVIYFWHIFSKYDAVTSPLGQFDEKRTLPIVALSCHPQIDSADQ